MNNITTRENSIIKVGIVTIICNILLSIFKAIAGILSHSTALITDAIHSATDVVSTFVLMAGVKMGSRKPDEKYPYGYERMENVAAIILSIILTVAAVGIGISGINKITGAESSEIAIPGLLALITAIVSILIKEMMYWYTRHNAKQHDSGALMADAWHHRSDALSSVSSLIGIVGARMGFPILDPIASLVICIFIMKAAYDVFMDAIGKMTDKAVDKEIREELFVFIDQQVGFLGIETMKTRMFGEKIYVDVKVKTYKNIRVDDATAMRDNARLRIEQQFPKIKQCQISLVPADVELSIAEA